MDAETTAVRVVVEGKWSSPVTINGVRPRVVRAAAPMIGSHLTCPGKGEGVDIRQLTVELRRTKGATYEYHAAKDDTNKSLPSTLKRARPSCSSSLPKRSTAIASGWSTST